jgi:ABC-type oligopeptide transport system substrate-binding subunit
MRALALAGKRTDALAHYNTLQKLLEKELAAEPSTDISALYESILTGDATAEAVSLVTVERSLTEETPLDLESSLPISGPAPPRPLFVGRGRQLAWLDKHLQALLDGHAGGNVVFVAGDAGMGKTSLLQAFAEKATEEVPELLVSWGACNAFIGSGDAYQPFRQALGMLSGDIESSWRAGIISTEQARRLWTAHPYFGQGLVEHGRAVATALVNGRALLGRSRASFPQGGPWLDELDRIVARAEGTLAQDELYQQSESLLRHLAARQPHLILLDDLQWVDSASLNLLFHLSRTLAGSRVLIVGAYRPEDVALGRDGEKHPLERVVAELRRFSGDVTVDLGETESGERRAFVDDLLNSEPNALGGEFRQALFSHTGGQALFTVEMLRYLQDRGDLVKDDDGLWAVSPMLAWDALPDRVEGVIEARIGRLEDELRGLLNVAAVEGENFTAQVIARVQAINERSLLGTLSGQLEKKHRLIRERSALKHGRQLLSRFRFSHTLFQRYLYNDLGLSERQLLHAEIAAILEELYEDQIDEIAVLLAGHYRAAGQDDEALPYLLRAGDQARDRYALEQAAKHYDEALGILRRQGDHETAYQILLKLGQTYHSAFEYERAGEVYREAFLSSTTTRQDRPARQLSSDDLPTVSWARRPIPFRTLDFTSTISSIDFVYISHLFSGLLQLSPELDVMPNIAASWQISDDGLTYRFHLRDDMIWSDGRPVTAHDFEYTCRRILNPHRASPHADFFVDIIGAAEYLAGESDRLGIRSIDDWTLQITLERPAAYFLHLLAIAANPVPRHAIEAHGEAWSDPANIVTNGPFVLERLPEAWQEGESLLLRRSPTYRGLFPGNVERVNMQLSDSPVAIFEDYRKGKLDFCGLGAYLPIADYRRVLQLHGAERHRYPLANTRCMVFNTGRPPFDDARVRRAFALAVDRQALANERDIIADGGFIPPGMPGHAPGITLPYDLEGARHLLAEAGYPSGRRIPAMKVDIGDLAEDIIEKLERFWGDGLDATIQWVRSDQAADPNDSPLYFGGWNADYADPDNFMRIGLQSISNWTNDSFNRLVAQANLLQDQHERMQLYRQAEEILVTEAPIIPLFYGKGEWLIKPWVTNWRPLEFGQMYTHHVTVEPH